MDFIRVRLNFKYRDPDNWDEWIRYKVKKEKNNYYLMTEQKIMKNIIKSKALLVLDKSLIFTEFIILNKEQFEELGIWIS